MSDVTFTPGPWSIQLVVKEDTGWKAMVYVGEGNNYGNPICKVFMGGPGALFSAKEEVEANAKLIAAAPDLFKALDRLRRAHDVDGIELTEALIEADKAIAKATT